MLQRAQAFVGEGGRETTGPQAQRRRARAFDPRRLRGTVWKISLSTLDPRGARGLRPRANRNRPLPLSPAVSSQGPVHAVAKETVDRQVPPAISQL